MLRYMLIIIFEYNQTVNRSIQGKMLPQPKTLQYQHNLSNILSSTRTKMVKVALLKSLKEQLQQTLRSEMKKAALQITPTLSISKEKVKENLQQHKEKSIEASVLLYSNTHLYDCFDQQEQRKAVMSSLSHLFKKRASLGQLHQKIQTTWLIKQNERQKQDTMKDIMLLNDKMKSLVHRFQDLVRNVDVQLQNHQEAVKILKVKYIRLKESIGKHGLRQEKKHKKMKEVKQRLYNYCINDENNNQILVNL